MFSYALLFGSLVASVAAHGYVASMVIGGKTYTGPSPYGSSAAASPIRKITTINPITDVNSKDMTCGIGAKVGTASVVAPATAGSQITFTWKSGQGLWGHSVGPLETYIAKCDGPCESFDPTHAQFFKIAETGRKPNSMDWYQADIKAGKSYTTTLPAHLPDGDYIIRHEIIALHFANTKNGAQFYPSCSQVRISGGSNAKSLAAGTNGTSATFPGGYTQNGPGIYVPDVYTSKAYTFPGPKVASFSTSSNVAVPVSESSSTTPIAISSTATHAASSSSTAPHTSTVSASPSPSKTPKSCAHKPNAKRRFSRVMRDISI